MKLGRMLIGNLTILVMLGLLVQPFSAQGQGKAGDGPLGFLNVDDQIPVQGRLTDAGGIPLNGSYDIAFRIYDSTEEIAAPICQNYLTNVAVTNGLFNVTLEMCAENGAMNGRQLYLGVKVGADSEMTPRLPIYPVPYAQTLRAGATVGGDIKQPLPSGGLIKAGVLINECGASNPVILRSFNNVNGNPITVASGSGVASCILDLGFDRRNRFIVATAYGTLVSRIVSLQDHSDNQKVYIIRTDKDGALSTGQVMVLVY